MIFRSLSASISKNTCLLFFFVLTSCNLTQISKESRSPDTVVVFRGQEIVDSSDKNKTDFTDIDKVFRLVFNNMPDVSDVVVSNGFHYFRIYESGHEYWGNFYLYEENVAPHFFFVFYKRENRPPPYKINVYFLENGSLPDLSISKIVSTTVPTFKVKLGNETKFFKIHPFNTSCKNRNIANTEKVFGTIKDESGVDFCLVFDNRNRSFFFTLESPRSTLIKSDFISETSYFQPHTGFFFDYEPEYDRFILIGVAQHDFERNTYFDGPSDQLPCELVESDAFLKVYSSPTYDAKANHSRCHILPNLNKDRLEDFFALAQYFSYFNFDEMKKANARCNQFTYDKRRACLTAPLPLVKEIGKPLFK
jgi:hypothetical protein